MAKGIVVDRKIPFGIGSDKFAGFSKLTEEMAETQVEIGKIMGAQSLGQHWDGKGGLARRLENEIADTRAAQLFVIQQNSLSQQYIDKRTKEKLKKFYKWHDNIQAGRDPNDNGSE